jgi:hypothetical protein
MGLAWRTSLCRTGQVITQVIEIHQIMGLCPKDPVNLLGNPGRSIPQSMHLSPFAEARAPGTFGQLLSCRLGITQGGSKDWINRTRRTGQG